MKKKAEGRVDHRWKRDSSKESFWKEQLELWQKSGLSVRAFCAERGIVETSFYAWRRELIIRAREEGDVSPSVAASPNTLKDQRGRTIPVRFRQTDDAPMRAVLEQGNPFVPLSVLPDTSKVGDLESEQRPAGLIITTPRGYRLSIATQSDLELLRLTIKILEET
ncbi:MAG TPA: hypothetical protein V6C81_18515 [Planktothrix sp.]